jgi:DNA-binding transcriptional LysR family regulator
MRNRLSLADLQGTRLLARAYDENAGAVTELLKAAGIEQKAGDHVVSDQDLLTLIEANLGTAIMPHSSSGASTLISKPVEGLTLRRQVSLYAAAGRERSPAASALMKLLRAIDWEAMPLVARGEALPA